MAVIRLQLSDLTTVNWDGWLKMTKAEQDDARARYREIVKGESDEALRTRYSAMNKAMAEAGRR